MLYFNRNGVWFTIPIAKDAVYSRELLEKQIHSSLLGLQNLKDRSPDLDQMRFEKPGEYVIKSVFGRDDILIIPPKIKPTKPELNPLVEYFDIPVPVYELYTEAGYNADSLSRFWICLSQDWGAPAITQIVSPIGKRLTTEIERQYLDEIEIYPLRRATVDSVCTEDWDSDTVNTGTDWSPGVHDIDDVKKLLIPSDGAWLGPNLSGSYWIADGYVIESCPDTRPKITHGNYLCNKPTPLLAWDPIGLNDYFYGWGFQYGTNLVTCDCAFVQTCATEVIDSSYVELFKLDAQTSTYQLGFPTTGSFTIGNEIAYSYAYDQTQFRTNTWTATKDADHEIGEVSTAHTGSEVYLLKDAASSGDSHWQDSEVWCAVFEVDAYSNETQNFTVDPWDVGDYTTALNSLVWPYKQKIVAKVAGYADEFVIAEIAWTTEDDWVELGCYHLEIYDFQGKPVYIIGAYIGGSIQCNIYAMIYGGKLFLSEQFGWDPDDPYRIGSKIYNSFTDWGLKSWEYARAAGVKIKQTLNRSEILQGDG